MTLHLAGAEWVLPLAAGLLALSGLIILWRLLRGPSRADRAVAIDALTLLAVAGMTLTCLIGGQAVFLDVAIMLALVSFLGTAAFAFLFDDAHSTPPPKQENTHE